MFSSVLLVILCVYIEWNDQVLLYIPCLCIICLHAVSALLNIFVIGHNILILFFKLFALIYIHCSMVILEC